MLQKVTDDEREQAVQAIMHDQGYVRKIAEWIYAEDHGEQLGCIVDAPMDTVDDLIAFYGDEVAAEVLQHPMMRERYGLPPLATAATQPAAQAAPV